MAQTKTKRAAAPKKAAPKRAAPKKAAPKAATTTRRRAATATRPAARAKAGAVEKTAELSDEVLQYVEQGQRAAIDAVRKFVDTVDRTLPALPHGDGVSRREEIVDSAMEMADRLVHTQYDFIRKVVDSAGKALSRSEAAK